MRFIKRYILERALDILIDDLCELEASLDACVKGGFKDVRIQPLCDTWKALSKSVNINVYTGAIRV